MEPQDPITSPARTIVSTNKTASKYRKGLELINQILARTGEPDGGEPTLHECLKVMKFYVDVKEMQGETADRSSSFGISDLERKVTEIENRIKTRFSGRKGTKFQPVDLGRSSDNELAEKIDRKLSGKFYGKIVVSNVVFPLFGAGYYTQFPSKTIIVRGKKIELPGDVHGCLSFPAKQILLSGIQTEMAKDILRFLFSTINPSEVFREDLYGDYGVYQFIRNKDYPLTDIVIELSHDCYQCRIRIGEILTITNSHVMFRKRTEKLCCIDSEAVKRILLEKDPTSETYIIPVLRGVDTMGFQVAKYLGVLI